jgi:hypothetical protein
MKTGYPALGLAASKPDVSPPPVSTPAPGAAAAAEAGAALDEIVKRLPSRTPCTITRKQRSACPSPSPKF